MDEDHHSELVDRGLELHESRRYEDALPLFEAALAACPTRPNAKYNLANTLHMLGRDEAASRLLHEIVDASDEVILSGCDDLTGTPRALRLDALYLLFLTTLHAGGSWRDASPYLRRHLKARTPGLRSLWSKAEVIRDADELRRHYAPRSTPVPEWGE